MKCFFLLLCCYSSAGRRLKSYIQETLLHMHQTRHNWQHGVVSILVTQLLCFFFHLVWFWSSDIYQGTTSVFIFIIFLVDLPLRCSCSLFSCTTQLICLFNVHVLQKINTVAWPSTVTRWLLRMGLQFWLGVRFAACEAHSFRTTWSNCTSQTRNKWIKVLVLNTFQAHSISCHNYLWTLAAEKHLDLMGF